MTALLASRRRRTPTILQYESAECGVACLAIILAHFGRWVPIEELREVAAVNRDGVKASNLLKAAAFYGLKGVAFRIEPDDLSGKILPCIVFWNFNHFVVVERCAADKVWINDPATGPRIVTAGEFDRAFTGVMLSFERNDDFVRAGRGPSLGRDIRRTLAGFSSPLTAAVLGGVLLVAPGLIIPGLQRAFVDYYMIAGLTDWLWWLIGAIAAVAIGRGLLTFLQQRILARFQVRFGLTTSGRVLWHTLRLPIAFFAHRNSGEIANRITIADRLTSVLSGSVTVTLINLLAISAYAAVMLTYDVHLAAIVIVFALFNLALLIFLSRRLSDSHRRMLQDEARMQATLLQGFSNLETYRASGTETLFFQRWAGAHARVVSAEQFMGFWQRLVSGLPIFMTGIAGISIVVIGGVGIMQGALSVGMLVAFQTLTANFNAPVASATSLGGQMQQARGHIDRLGDVFKQRLDPLIANDNDPEEADLPPLNGALRIDAVSFGYAAVAPPFLRNISIDIPAGGRIGVTGASGSGKSTLARLMVGLITPRRGAIRLDGAPIASWPTQLLRAAVAYVDQTTIVFAGTVRDNLTMWDSTISEERMVAAARDAMVHEVIASRPLAYETRVDEGGRNFSAGERQRLAIARALALDPVLIVFDEAMSALDSILEQAIIDNIRRRGGACVLISHRISALRDCDEIIVLDDGVIAERGRHHALLAAGGRYQNLAEG